jgi:hypothetical protein
LASIEEACQDARCRVSAMTLEERKVLEDSARAMIAEGERNWKLRLVVTRKLSTENLKALWDAFDDVPKGQLGHFWPGDGSPHVEDVHQILNERGEGAYCAV